MGLSSQQLTIDGTAVVRLESELLKVDVAPSVGGRIVSLVHNPTGHEFLWRNQALGLERRPAGSEYDPNFYGGVDELLPNDIVEVLDGISCPDHGELWTTPLNAETTEHSLSLRGTLPSFGLVYEREMWLQPHEPFVHFKYRISNPTNQARHFLWKLHAALATDAADLIECPARSAQVVDPAWSRFKTPGPFAWPEIQGQRANVVPPLNGTMDFFYLFDLQAGEIALRSRRAGLEFRYQFDLEVFPYAWLFASYGGFNGHYTVILEPCTTMPLSVNEAAQSNRCSRLSPKQTIETSVTIYAGPTH